MGNGVLTFRGLRLLSALALALVLSFCVTAVADAETSAKNGQYANPTSSGEDIIDVTFTGGSGTPSNGDSGSLGNSGSAGVAGSTAGGSSGSFSVIAALADPLLGGSGGDPVAAGVAGIGVLPETGGTLVPYIALMVFVLSAASLVAVRRFNN